MNNDCTYWGITLKTDDKLIGTICIWNISPEENKAEIGYVLHPGHQGKGIMHEAITSVINYGFDKMNLFLLEAVLHPANMKSISLLKKTGFEYAGELEDEVIYKLINPNNL